MIDFIRRPPTRNPWVRRVRADRTLHARRAAPPTQVYPATGAMKSSMMAGPRADEPCADASRKGARFEASIEIWRVSSAAPIRRA